VNVVAPGAIEAPLWKRGPARLFSQKIPLSCRSSSRLPFRSAGCPVWSPHASRLTLRISTTRGHEAKVMRVEFVPPDSVTEPRHWMRMMAGVHEENCNAPISIGCGPVINRPNHLSTSRQVPECRLVLTKTKSAADWPTLGYPAEPLLCVAPQMSAGRAEASRAAQERTES
jgi:hypothetical protein